MEKKMDKLEEMFSFQKKFHELVGPSLKSASEAQCELMIVDSMRNLIFEAVEVTQELNYKPWKKARKEVDWRKVREEISDVFIFLMNAVLESGMTAEEFHNQVIKKVIKNVERQKNGY